MDRSICLLFGLSSFVRTYSYTLVGAEISCKHEPQISFGDSTGDFPGNLGEFGPEGGLLNLEESELAGAASRAGIAAAAAAAAAATGSAAGPAWGKDIGAASESVSRGPPIVGRLAPGAAG